MLPFTRLEGELKIVESDGTALADSKDVGFCNLFPNSIFKSLELSVNGVELQDQSSSTYPFKCYLEQLLSYGSESKNTHLQTEYWIKDASGDEDTVESTNNAGKGFTKRAELAKESNVIQFSSQLHADFFNQRR